MTRRFGPSSPPVLHIDRASLLGETPCQMCRYWYSSTVVLVSSFSLLYPFTALSSPQSGRVPASSKGFKPTSSSEHSTASKTNMACPIEEDVALSSRRCAGARYLFEDVVRDPLAPILAGEEIIASERINKAKNAVYPVVAIRTRWIDDKIEEVFSLDPTLTQVVLCGAGMDARGLYFWQTNPNHIPPGMTLFQLLFNSYRLEQMKKCQIYELDVKPVLDYKTSVLAGVADRFPLLARSVHRLISDFADDVHWVRQLKEAGFDPEKKTVWILEGFLYYFPEPRVQTMLGVIRALSSPGSLLLADHVNDFTLASLRAQAGDKWLTSTFSSAMEEPETTLSTLGFEEVEVVTVGENGAHYGLWALPVVPRAEKKDVMRTYLIRATVGSKS